ncbi:MAG: prolyl oligopeptidase family serine peptidase [Oscillospiraceae bacterium]|nr:prolyl oligopeptidase family serine peptidase [Oscillospiraceae bacterium]
MLTIFIIAAVAVVLVLLISYICFRIVFYVPRGKEKVTDELPVPSGKVYEPYHEMMKKWIVDARSRDYTDYYIKSFDGLTLHAKYFEYSKDAALEIMFHGYRGSAERDLSGGLQRCFALGRNVLLVDQRTSCGSEGNVISFGINEHRDCLSWIDFAVKEFGEDITILITGISMGASTVLMAAGKPLPPNVKGVLADCGFSTAKDIIKKCSRDLHLPADAVYPFIKLGAKLYGHFDLEEYSALEAVQNCTIPVIFVHNEGDDFVPCEMSRILYNACKATKRLVIMEGEGHGLAYLLDNKKYFDNLTEFHTQNGIPTKLLQPII